MTSRSMMRLRRRRARAQDREVHVLEIWLDGLEALLRPSLVQHVHERPPFIELRGDHRERATVCLDRRLVGRLLPDLAVELRDQRARCTRAQHTTLGENRHARTELPYVFDDVRGEN